MGKQYGHNTKDASIASGATFSTFVKTLGYSGIAIDMPAFGTLLGTNAANVYINVAADTSTTANFKRLKALGVYSAASGVYDWEISSTSGPFIAVCDPAVGFAWARVELSTAATDAISCTIHLYHK
jgi:hypothetical protein